MDTDSIGAIEANVAARAATMTDEQYEANRAADHKRQLEGARRLANDMAALNDMTPEQEEQLAQRLAPALSPRPRRLNRRRRH